MARIRSAKPEFWTDPLMTSLSRDLRFTFKGIFEVCADDFGRFLGDIRLIKSQVWPLDDDLTHRKLEGFLRELHRLGRVRLYEVDGVRYGQVVNWERHQKVSHRSPSRIPPEPVASTSGAAPEGFGSDSGPRVRAVSGKGGEGIGEDRNKRADTGVKAEATADTPTAPPLASLEQEQPQPPRESWHTRTMDEEELDDPNPRDEPELPDKASRDKSTLATPPSGKAETPQAARREMPASPSVQVSEVVLPHAAVQFGKTFYGNATDERKRDVYEQLVGLLTPNHRTIFDNGVIQTQTHARLSRKCYEILKSPPRDPDAAIVILLTKLSDTSDDPPTESAATNGRKVELNDSLEFDERNADAQRWAMANPEKAQELRLEASGGRPWETLGDFARMAFETAFVSLVHARYGKTANA